MKAKKKNTIWRNLLAVLIRYERWKADAKNAEFVMYLENRNELL